MILTCPLCGFESQLHKVEAFRPEVFCCDCEEGGCDQYFAASVSRTQEDFGDQLIIRYQATVYKLGEVPK